MCIFNDMNRQSSLNVRYEQALVCLSNREIFHASRGRTFHCKMANDRFFLVMCRPNLFSHLSAFNYNGRYTTSLRVDGSL